MLPLLSASQMREVDRATIEGLCVPEMILMEHAALATARAVRERYGSLFSETRGVVLAGPGNNGGDAIAAARILAHWGCTRIFVALFTDEHHLTASTSLQLKMLGRLSVPWGRELAPECVPACDWVVDGLFGTGLKRAPEGAAREAIEAVNCVAGMKWVISIDIPSGLSSDTGNPLGVAIKASETVALGFLKKGLVTGQAANYVGRMRLVPLQMPRLLTAVAAEAFLYTAEDARRLPERLPASHKGDYGHVYVWAGTPEREGACVLTSLCALRAGAGLVSLVGEKDQLEAMRPRLPPEIMTERWSGDLLSKKSAQVAAIGPGFGVDESRWQILEAALGSDWSLVLDADALTLLARRGESARALVRKRSDHVTVLTPHPKEAARLLGCEVEQIERDRYDSCREIAERYQAFVLLKGRGTLVGGVNRPIIAVTSGDTGLAKGGTGDLLTGVIAALLAQRVAVDRAVPLAAYLHGRASEILTQRYGQERSTLPTEIAGALPEVLREIEWHKQF